MWCHFLCGKKNKCYHILYLRLPQANIKRLGMHVMNALSWMQLDGCQEITESSNTPQELRVTEWKDKSTDKLEPSGGTDFSLKETGILWNILIWMLIYISTFSYDQLIFMLLILKSRNLVAQIKDIHVPMKDRIRTEIILQQKVSNTAGFQCLFS